jgi:hypothetical protein
MVPGPRPQLDVPPDPLLGSTAAPGSTALPRGCRQIAAARVRLGTRRADRLRGTRRADLIRGRAGNDRISARAGAGCVFGGPGADLLVGGPGRDLLDCGPGRRDRVVPGRGDRVRNCERRLRRRP